MLDANVHPACEVEYLDGPWAGLTQVQRDARFKGAGAEPPAQGRTPGRTRLKKHLGDLGLHRLALVPDASVAFWRGAAPRIRRVIERERAELLITGSPPHSIHMVGLGGLGIPWVMDFQDPYLIDVRWRPTGLAAALTLGRHRQYERRCYAEGSVILHANAVHERWARLSFPGARRRCRLLPPFCPADIVLGMSTPDRAAGGRRSIRVVGFIGGEEAVLLAEAVCGLARRGIDAELRLVGREPDTAGRVRAILGDRAVLTGRLVHEQAKRQILGADLLVSFLSPYRASYHGVSSKLYEFIAARKPIIHINPTVPDRHLLRRMPTIRVLERPGREMLEEALLRGLSEEAAEEARASPDVQSFIRSHSWSAHAAVLGEALEAAERHVRRTRGG